MKVYWTEQAKRRLRAIEQRIAADSPLVAPKVVRRILLQSGRISLLPRAGRVVPEFEREDVREVLLRPYRIIYRILDERIDVLTIRHYRELLDELPKI